MAKFEQPTPERIAQIPRSPQEIHLKLSEIFYSIQGEGTRAGEPCLFIRLQGCTLRCSWCDTPYALDHRKFEMHMTAEQILRHVENYRTHFVELTGGEPLEQWGSFHLIEYLCDMGRTVAVETGGHISIEALDPRAIGIVDFKCPDSRMEQLNYLPNVEFLRPHDEVKFVIASARDYHWATAFVERYDLSRKVAAVLYSPAYGILPPRQLAAWILADQLPVRLQLQLHKFIWESHQRGV